MVRPSHAAAAVIACLLAAVSVSANVDVPLGYRTLLKTSTKVGNHVFGAILNEKGQPFVEVDGNNTRTNKPIISFEPDFTSLLEVPDGKGKKKLFMVTNFERPAAQYVVELEQRLNGDLIPKSLKPIDWSKEGGLWIPCAGMRTPWMTHMTAEEYEPDARPFSDAKDLESLKALLDPGWGWWDVEAFLRYFDIYPLDQTYEKIVSRFNPYRYGHIAETTIRADGSAVTKKWYTFGRASWEMALVMPDRRTFYGTDDGTNVGFFRFVADRPSDLSSGTLYAAQFKQSSAENGGTFTLNWILLGKGKDAAIRQLAEKTKFSDIFEAAPWNATTMSCPAGFKSINQDDNGVECLKLKKGAAQAAAFLETRRYAAYLGATTEFSKWEGVTFDPVRRQLYTSMSSIRNGMEDYQSKGKNKTDFDQGGPNHIRLPYNKCGCVYKLQLDKSFTAYSMAALVCGSLNPDTEDYANACALDGIASPDNVNYVPELDTLLIAEDSEYHENNVMWAYNMKSGSLKRILSTPYGAEVTSPYFYPNVNGRSYIMALAMHPYEYDWEAKLSEPEATGKDATVGFFTWKTKAMNGVVGAEFFPIPFSKTRAQKHSIRSTNKATFLTKNRR